MFVYNDLSIAKNRTVFNTGVMKTTNEKTNTVSDNVAKTKSKGSTFIQNQSINIGLRAFRGNGTPLNRF